MDKVGEHIGLLLLRHTLHRGGGIIHIPIVTRLQRGSRHVPDREEGGDVVLFGVPEAPFRSDARESIAT